MASGKSAPGWVHGSIGIALHWSGAASDSMGGGLVLDDRCLELGQPHWSEEPEWIRLVRRRAEVTWRVAA